MTPTNKPECCENPDHEKPLKELGGRTYHEQIKHEIEALDSHSDMKQDTVWERDFDAGHNHMNISDPASDTEWVKNFIRTHFLPRTEVAEAIEFLQRANAEDDAPANYKYGANHILDDLKDRLGF